jgi:hypothetical protein
VWARELRIRVLRNVFYTEIYTGGNIGAEDTVVM